MTSALSSRVLLCAAIFAASLLVAPTFAQDAPPAIPDSSSKAALIQYQQELEKWGSEAAQNADEFLEKTGALYYE